LREASEPAAAVKIEPADDEMFRERARWRYPPPYDFYDDDGKPVKNPERFLALRGDDGSLIGFYYFEADGDALFYGLGLRPDLTGRGLGESFVRVGLDYALTHFGPRRVVLDVAAFNQRAFRVYRGVGFVETGRHPARFDGYGDVEFIDMERLP
jgi:ribosomal-protein-alanine N-acetyltransferase